ncbi:MAG: intradiol ring-cleavage dioxygenase [Caldilineaceae bacterium]
MQHHNSIEEHEHDDDKPVGRILSRREIFTLLGSVGSAVLIAGGFRAVMADSVYLPLVANNGAPGTIPSTATPTATGAPTATSTATGAPTATTTPVATATSIPLCVVSPELTEGPYFVDEQLNRADIRIDPSDNSVRDGAQLNLTLRAYAVSGGSCTPLVGAVFDIWHCDAAGLYSDVQSEGTAGQKFLRGYQVTDANGVVNFTTIYPGWYSGRAVHIHFKLRGELSSNPSYEFTSQFFFDDTFTDAVYTQQPYAARGTRNTYNRQDNIYQGGGSQLLLNVSESGGVYAATFDIGVAM